MRETMIAATIRSILRVRQARLGTAEKGATLRASFFRGWPKLTVLGLFAVALNIVQASAGEPSWTGSWDTRWRGGGARMELLEGKGTVTGQYSAYGGQIEGVIEGRELKGRWIEGPRSGGIDFVLAPDGQSFMGRFDNGEWWTGGRVREGSAAVTVDQSGAREALRTLIDAGNMARLGALDELAKAAAVTDFGAAGATMAPGEKIEAARNLFDLIDLTTFHLWTIPGKRAQGDRLDLVLNQAGSNAILPLTLLKRDGRWYISAPDSTALGEARKALLARFGGRLPAPDDYKRRRSARDTMRSFVASFADWDGGGREQALAALDLSGLSDAVRDYEGELAAQYLKEVLDRIGVIVPQEISDDPNSSEPYVAFSHPAGQIIIAAHGTGDKLSWKFSQDTVRSARDLYVAVEDIPKLGNAALATNSGYFAIRRWVRDAVPRLLGMIGVLELWQLIGWIAVFALSLLLGFLVSALVLAVMRRSMGRHQYDAERDFRWPLWMALTFSIYKLVIPVIGLPELANRFSVGATGVLLAIALMWGGWRLVNLLTDLFFKTAMTRGASLDHIILSLAFGVIKLALIIGGLIFIAIELSLPYDSVLAGLSIGGLAVAFASRETLSNVFGAAILAIDRPFRRGDWIVAGEAQGIVEQVGIRSTRIRTGQDSLVIVPNGKLSDAIVNNLGSRRYHLNVAKLPLSYSTSVSQLEALTKGLKELIAATPHAVPERSLAVVAALGSERIEIELTLCINGRKSVDDIAIVDTLMREILKLGERLGIRFGDQYETRERRGQKVSVPSP
jgi:MscS family membrane protein